MLCIYFFFLFGLKMSFFETMRKNLVNLVCLWVKERKFPPGNFHTKHFFCLWRLNLLIFVTFMSSPVWWQSRWWFMTNDGWTSPPRWLCSGSWCAIGPWPPCISAITMDGFWFSNSSLILCSCRKILLRFFALISLSCYGFNLIFICWRHFFMLNH